MATALIRPLAWEPPCAVEATLEKAKRQKDQKKKKKKIAGPQPPPQKNRKTGDAAAVARVKAAGWIRSLARELPYAEGAVIKKKKKKKKKKDK